MHLRCPMTSIALLLLVSLTTGAQTPPPAPKPTLATALAAAVPPAQGVALTVDAGNINLPKDAEMPGPRTGVTVVGETFGRVVRRFGAVTAIAPPTMTVLNTAPSNANPFDGMPTYDAFKLFAASLTDSQWQSLISEQGLGVSSLTTDTQRQLFAQLLSDHGKLQIAPMNHDWTDKDIRDITSDLPQARLRLARTVSLGLPIKGQDRSYYPGQPIPAKPGAPPEYQIVQRTTGYGGGSDQVYGVTVRDDVPNSPKQSQLNFGAPALQAGISLTGIKTVGDLISRVAGITHLEIYADPRYADHTLTLLGPANSIQAVDLLKALAFCLTGTYRQVGPAYVLTDDIIGIGTKKQLWYDFELMADAERGGAVQDAGQALFTRHDPRKVSWFGDPLAYSAEESKPDPKDRISSYGYETAFPEFLPTLSQSLDKFTPEQQDAIRRAVDQFNTDIAGGRSGNQPTTLDAPITMDAQLKLQLLAPSLDGPVDMQVSTDEVGLFQAPPDVAKQREAEINEIYRKLNPNNHPPTPSAKPKVPLKNAFSQIPYSAVLVQAKTPAEVDADVAAMKMMGLNQLWLSVFSGGVPCEPAILTEAIKASKSAGIQVYPVLDLLSWGDSPPPQDTDLTILGDTSAQAAARWNQRKDLMPGGQEMSEYYTSNSVIPNFPGVAVSPMAPEVRQTLAALVRSLAHRPGVAGLVWRTTDPPGYDLPGEETSSQILGYSEDMRLAFLRKSHADPVDIFPSGHYQGKANTNIAPYFSDEYFDSGNKTGKLSDQWKQFRHDTNIALLQSLYATATVPGKKPMLWLRQRGTGPRVGYSDHQGFLAPWYGSWDSPQAPLPSFGSDLSGNSPGSSRLSLMTFSPEQLRFLEENSITPANLRQEHRNGLVLDFLDDIDSGLPAASLMTFSPSQRTLPALAAALNKK